MTTTATNAVGSLRQKSKSQFGNGKKSLRAYWRNEVDGVKCQECGCTMRRREGKHGIFHGCERFPLCCGTVPHTRNSAKPYDSYTQLLLDAHKRAVTYLSKPEMLGKAGCIAWFLKHPLVLTNNEELMLTVDAASAEASRLGEPKDFIQAAHNVRMARVRTEWREKYSQKYLRQLPKPVFTRRWDNSLIEQIEIDLEPTRDEDWDDDER
jgi:ssDNA-binding Zn-finger/Zn-ribbon topoisomerase 1